jgi:hypothetical protein
MPELQTLGITKAIVGVVVVAGFTFHTFRARAIDAPVTVEDIAAVAAGVYVRSASDEGFEIIVEAGTLEEAGEWTGLRGAEVWEIREALGDGRDQAWFGEEEKENAARLRSLLTVLDRLAGVKAYVFRDGVETTVYILGIGAEGRLMGVKTRLVE